MGAVKLTGLPPDASARVPFGSVFSATAVGTMVSAV